MSESIKVQDRTFPAPAAGGELQALLNANCKLAGALDMIRESLTGGNVDDLLYIINTALDAHYATFDSSGEYVS
jgi:hypothetical protein